MLLTGCLGRSFALVAALLGVPNVAIGQRNDIIAAGAPVRWIEKGEQLTRYGKLDSATLTGYSVTTAQGEHLQLDVGTLASLQIKTTRSRTRLVFWGAGIGAISGGIIGGVAGQNAGRACASSCVSGPVVVAGATTVAGAALGAAIGALLPARRWVSVRSTRG